MARDCGLELSRVTPPPPPFPSPCLRSTAACHDASLFMSRDFSPSPSPQVSLLSWVSRDGTCDTAYLNRASIISAVAVPGSAVKTFMGLGTVQLVREDSAVVVVPSWGGDGKGRTSASGSGRSR